jgi:hypothetical protein
MKRVTRAFGAAIVIVLCLLTGPASAPIQGAADTRAFSILQAELQRNFQILSKQDAPAYFISYTLHDTRTANLSASIGALQRSDGRSRFATVGCASATTSDNTHQSAATRAAGRV